jgi:hypothetical protein
MKYTLLALIFASNAFACPSHLRLGAGDKAPCNGYFFNDASELRIRTELTVKDKKIDNLEKSLTLKDLAIDAKIKESELWKSEAKRQAEVAADRKGDFNKGLWTGIGGSILLYLLMGAVKK